MFFSFVLVVFLMAQVVSPALREMVKELEDGKEIFSIYIFAEYLLKLGMASTYIWLLVFYGYFHVFFNLLAEVLKFGDRV
jgi:diacylglycerol O-acyltransferase-1